MNYIIIIICFIYFIYIISKKEKEKEKEKFFIINSNKVSKNIYDKIYVINLDKRLDRREQFTNSVKTSDISKIDYEWFKAVDGSKIDINKIYLTPKAKKELNLIEIRGYRTKHYQLTKGAIGCYLSHVNLWNEIKKNNIKNTLIFEDDVNLPNNINQLINNEIKHIPSDWDIILLGHIILKGKKYKNYYKVERFWLLHSYIINIGAVNKILNSNTLFPMSQQIDSYLSEISDYLNIYGIVNNKIGQIQSKTDIQMPLINKNKIDAYKQEKIIDKASKNLN